jgi:hypothetical protein
VLCHLLEHDAHAERAEAPSAVFFRRTKRPETGGLRLRRETAVVLFRNFGRVGIEPCFDGKDLVADKAVNLLAKKQELLGKLESGKAVHCGEVETIGGERRKA